MPSIDYLRGKLLAAPEPAEYLLYVDEASRNRMLAAQDYLDSLHEQRAALAASAPEDRRAKSIGRRPPTAELDEQIAAAEQAVDATTREAAAVKLRWTPQDPDDRHALVAKLTAGGRTATPREITLAQLAPTFAGAFTEDGTDLNVTWDDVRSGLLPGDLERIIAEVHSLNTRAVGTPLPRGSSGQPAPSSNPA